MKIKNLFAVLTGVSFILAACAPAVLPAAPPSVSTDAIAPEVAGEAADLPAAEAPASDAPEPSGWEVQVVAEGLDVPWSLVFTADERILVAERTGAVREISAGLLNPQPLYVFNDIVRSGEAGLMGLALDPGYADNRFVYACYAQDGASGISNQVARLVDLTDRLEMDAVILKQIPSARNHAGCRLRFGPDGMLYITTGDALDTSTAQNPDSLAGKILRANPDGSVPDDNPFPESLVYSYGHRNPQGIDWQPGTGLLFSSEHGPSGFDGPGGGDEINIIQPGGNYGWPLVSHDDTLEGTIPPIIQFTPAEAPASLSFYSGDVLPMFDGDLFFGALRGEGLVRVSLDENDPARVLAVEKIVNDVGRVREVVQGPDGLIYFTTSNRDGRGRVQPGDDKVLRIVPLF
jgi:glucose/arabinose dehydrogenase